MKRLSWTVLGWLVLMATAQAASFNCAKAKSKIEKLICGDAELSKLDEDLNKAYLQALRRSDVKRKAVKSQRQWLKNERNVCQNAECTKVAYETRIKELGFTSSFGIVFSRPTGRSSSPPKIPVKTPKPLVAVPPVEALQTTEQQPALVNTSVYNTLVVSNSGSLILAGNASTVAGRAGLTGTKNGLGTIARFNHPFGITTDGMNLYISETGSHTIRKIVIATGKVITLAGSAGKNGAADGKGRQARFHHPYGMTTDGINLYVVDATNNTIRKIIIATGRVTTLAGIPGMPGSADGAGKVAQFSYPHDITTDGTNLYVTDGYNHNIRKIVIATGEVTTFAGTAGSWGFADGIGAVAQFNSPDGITTDGATLYVVDGHNQTIRKIVIATGEVTTLAGPDNATCAAGLKRRCPGGATDGTGAAARFNYPTSITTDGINLYVTGHSDSAIRKITIATGEVTTLAGSARNDESADGKDVTAWLRVPAGITTDGTGLYVTDVMEHTIIKIQ